MRVNEDRSQMPWYPNTAAFHCHVSATLFIKGYHERYLSLLFHSQNYSREKAKGFQLF